MSIEKLPSGSYRITQMCNGKRYRTTLPYKPTQKEATIIMAELMKKDSPTGKTNCTVGYCMDQYLNDCRNRKRKLSPSTIDSYGSNIRNTPEWFKDMRLYDVTDYDIARLVDELKSTRSNKTVKNMMGYLRGVFAKYRRDFVLRVDLVGEEPKHEYEPTTEDVLRILEYADSINSKYSVAIHLAALGLRRGEILALELSDLSDDNFLTINKSIVQNENNEYVLKGTKTEASNRTILIPSSLADKIREQGYIYKGHPHKICAALHRYQDKLEIPRFRLHMLRHFLAAYLHHEGYTSEQIMSWGGWSTDHIMKSAYRYDLDPKESQKDISNSMASLFSKSHG